MRAAGDKNDEESYTYFGRVLEELLSSRGYSQSSFAQECRRQGARVRQNSLSNWMLGKNAAPRWFPSLADRILDLNDQEWAELGLSFAYGQMMPPDRRTAEQQVAQERRKPQRRLSPKSIEEMAAFRDFYEAFSRGGREYWSSGSLSGSSDRR